MMLRVATLVCILLPVVFWGESYVVYQVSGGRFGDHVTGYLHGKWAARALNLPLVFCPFDLANRLQLSKETLHLELDKSRFDIRHYQWEDDELVRGENDLFYVNHFTTFTTDVEEHRKFSTRCFLIDWRDKDFLSEARHLIHPLELLNLVEVGEECMALHYREGGNFDDQNNKILFPTRFPSRNYYIEGVKAMLGSLRWKNPSLTLFTDALDKEELRCSLEEELREYFPNLTIELSLGPILEDFFSLGKFLYIVQAESLFSLNAARLGSAALTLKPQLFACDRKRRMSYILPVVLDMTYKKEIERAPLYLECHEGSFEKEMSRVLKALWTAYKNNFRLEVFFDHPIFENLKSSYLKKIGDESSFTESQVPIDWSDTLFCSLARDYFSPKCAPTLPLNKDLTSYALIVQSEQDVDFLLKTLKGMAKTTLFEVTVVFMGNTEIKASKKVKDWLKKEYPKTPLHTLSLQEAGLDTYLTLGFHTYVIADRPSEFVKNICQLFGAALIVS